MRMTAMPAELLENGKGKNNARKRGERPSAGVRRLITIPRHQRCYLTSFNVTGERPRGASFDF